MLWKKGAHKRDEISMNIYDFPTDHSRVILQSLPILVTIGFGQKFCVSPWNERK